jgi:diguanylate cyclase (GGDEF)-like protein/PAS domain S-box-containing protein
MVSGNYIYWMVPLFVILGCVAAYAGVRLARSLSTSQEAEARFRVLAEAIPEIVWTAAPGGNGLDFSNQRWFDLTGMTPEQTLGWGWKDAIHPNDLSTALANWEKSRETGVGLSTQYRLRMRSGDYRWYLARATPMKDSCGKIIKWFGSCVDIDDQIRHQELLEEQIRQHTAALRDANARLETEMRERALAQQELNQQNAQMVRELTMRSQRATRLAKTAELLQSCVDQKDIYSVAVGMVPKVFPEFRGAMFLFNSGHDVLELAGSWGDCSLPANIIGPQDCWALRTGHLHVVPMGDHTAECRHVDAGQFSYFCVPLLSQGHAVGLLHFQKAGPGEIHESAISMGNTFVEQVGLSIANLRLREALRNQSIRDPLTGLFNRRYLEEMMNRETRRAVRAEHGLGVLLLDLDHFKKFNDTYGHDAGDTVLRETAAFLSKSVRTEDIVCRFGGEEFVAILPMADLKTTQARAERIRSRLREMTVVHEGQSLGPITVSVGVVALPEHGTTPKELLDTADAALYRAKREGRDRVVVADLSAADQAPSNLVEAAALPKNL